MQDDIAEAAPHTLSSGVAPTSPLVIKIIISVKSQLGLIQDESDYIWKKLQELNSMSWQEPEEYLWDYD